MSIHSLVDVLQVPDETRVACIDYARMENYKKDQHVYMIGDLPTKFYMILTGQPWMTAAYPLRSSTIA